MSQLPRISNKPSGQQQAPAINAPAQQDPTPWLPRTNIVLQPFTETTRSFKISLSAQNSSIKAVIGAAIKYGAVQLIVNDKFCGLKSTGLKELTIASLLHASEEKGFDGEFDIADRLERGSNDRYIKPLTRYVRSFSIALMDVSLSDSTCPYTGFWASHY